MFNTLAPNLGILSAIPILRDWFLVPVRVGDDDGCEGLQKKVDDLKRKMDVNIPIKVAEYPLMPWAAHGTACFGAAGITVPSKEIDPEKREEDDLQIAILAHEISHIKHNDGAWIFAVTVVSVVASYVLAWLICPPAWIFVAEQVVAIPLLAAMSARSRRQEHAADVEACKYLTDRQKEKIGDWFENIRHARILYRNAPNLSTISTLWRKFWINSEGEHLIGRLTHPTQKSRVQYFRSQIRNEPSKTSFFPKWIPTLRSQS